MNREPWHPKEAKPSSFKNLAFDTGRVYERVRIIKLILQIRDTWVRPPSFNYRNELTRLVDQIDKVDDAE